MILAILANAIPIFFGGDDIFDYVNPKRIIVCLHGISRKEIEKVIYVSCEKFFDVYYFP